MNLWIGAAIFLTIGISLLGNTRDWLRFLEALERKGHCGSLTMGVFCLFTGGYILSLPSLWHGITMVLPLLGIVLFLKGMLYVFSPGTLPSRISLLHPYLSPIIRLAGLMFIFAGLALFGGFVNVASEAHIFPRIHQAQ